jgi:hypothetical protein
MGFPQPRLAYSTMSKSTTSEMNTQPLKTKWLVGVLLFFTFYATMRYIVFKGVDVVHFPVYIVNKIVSVAGIFFIAMSYVIGKVGWLKFQSNEQREQFIRYVGLSGFSLCALHVFLSLILITPGYFPKFYTGSMMNLKGEMTMLMGVLSLYCFSIPAITTLPFMQEAVGIKKWQKGQSMGYYGLLTSLLHTTIMGASGWLVVSKWPGYMPPISLISTIIALVPLYLKLTKKKANTAIEGDK